ncbi:tripartite tricarboxylate transporter TctB family protein [Chelativorans sp.]|uniref:tripartite tricarboxylate transporter TctB family protein n=1 Tax=Chelativorans sp. TaxID=2203393 RepID=UPI002811B133|nr:tripartite tricarboxylate transporter TctB family protein [Chelativorans sp.]
MISIKSPQDFGAGVLFILIGAIGILTGQDLAFGSARSMGPGFFPTIICALIILIGLIVAGKALVVEGPAIERIQFRPIFFLIVAIAAFGFLISKVGVVISAILMIVLAAYARREKVNILETLIFAAATAFFIVLIFVYALEQPMPVWWW